MRWSANRVFAALSGGERQRVLVAKALIQQAPVLLLDEPTNHLDIGAQPTPRPHDTPRPNKALPASAFRAFHGKIHLTPHETPGLVFYNNASAMIESDVGFIAPASKIYTRRSSEVSSVKRLRRV